nr:hypothetical protein [Tanacetum cinerariifolium]
MGGNDDEAGSSRSKCSRQFETVEEVLLPQVHHEFLLWEGCNKEAKSRLGLYHAEELDEEGFDVYFQGCMHSDDHFNAQEYWLSTSREENLSLSKSHTFTIQSLILRTPKRVCKCGLVDCEVDEEKRSWYSKGESDLLDLDTTTLGELIDSEGRLIPEDPWSGAPRVAIPRPPRASTHDLYERMSNMEIRQGAIEWMSYRQSCHWDMYAGVIKHIAGVYSVPLQGAYNPPEYAQPQYDQYYQQYPPQLPQFIFFGFIVNDDRKWWIFLSFRRIIGLSTRRSHACCELEEEVVVQSYRFVLKICF